MKKLLAMILILALLMPAFALADPAEITEHYSIYGRTKDAEYLFPGDCFSIDLYMTVMDLNAYIIITTWDEHDMSTLQKPAAIKSKQGEDHKLYFVFPDESYYTGYYDGEYSEYFWLDIGGKSFRLRVVDWFNPYTDMRDVE